MPARTTLARLRPLLFSADEVHVEQGVELLRALEDAPLVERLLDGVRYEPDAPAESDSLFALPHRGALVAPDTFAPRAPPNARLRALLGLVATRLGPRATALHDAVTHLAVDHLNAPHDEPLTLSAAPFAGLTALRELTLEAPELTHLEALRALPSLRALHLGALRPTDLSALAGLSLDHLSLAGEGITDVPLASLAVRSLSLSSRAVTSLAGLPRSVESLTLRDCKGLTAPEFPELPALQTLTLTGNAPALALPSPRSAPSLRELHVTQLTAALAPLVGHPSLRAITFAKPELHVRRVRELPAVPFDLPGPLSFAGGPLEDLRGVGRFAPRETLILTGCTRLRSLDGVEELASLRTLDLRGCLSLADVSALAKLPALTRCLLAGVALPDEAIPPSARAVVSRALRPATSPRAR